MAATSGTAVEGKGAEAATAAAEVMAARYDPQGVEQKWYDYWQDEGLFKADAHSDKPPYTIVLPPPNVTGVLHMGHALVDTLQVPPAHVCLCAPVVCPRSVRPPCLSASGAVPHVQPRGGGGGPSSLGDWTNGGGYTIDCVWSSRVCTGVQRGPPCAVRKAGYFGPVSPWPLAKADMVTTETPAPDSYLVQKLR